MKKKQQSTAEVPDVSAAQPFLTHLWQPLPGGLIEIRVLANDKASGLQPRQEWFEEVENALQFATQFDEKRNGYSVYFGVAKRRREGGGKQDVLGVTTLWADIDTVNLGWDTDRCAKILHDAPREVSPSALIHSGGGLHAYWFLKSPLMAPAQTKLIETANAKLATFVSGDDVGNIDRILRLPDSWNAKRGIARARRCEVLYCYHWFDYDAPALTRAVEVHGPLFVGPEFSQRNDRRPNRAALGKAFRVDPGIGVEELWTKRVRYHAAGGKYVGVHDAITTTIARLHCLGWSDDRIVDEVLRRVKRIQASQAPNEDWDWAAEREIIRKSLERWKPKWRDLCKPS